MNHSNDANKLKKSNNCKIMTASKVLNMPLKIYFPTISINKIKEIIDQSNTVGVKSYLSKYLIDEKNKITIYGDTGIFEMLHNNNLYQLYPNDRNIKESVINNSLKILIDSSYMRLSDNPSYQIPYCHVIQNRIIKTYKPNIKSNVKFIIEVGTGSDNVCDFYMMITMADINYNEKNEIEINNFVKDEIMSFLLTLNLYR